MRKKLWYIVKYTCLLGFLVENRLVRTAIIIKYMFHSVPRRM